MEQLSNRTALITGCAKRIGKEIAIELALCGINIALHYNSSKKEALELQEIIKKTGVDCQIFQADLNKNCYEDLITKVAKYFPNFDILINNASIFEPTPFLKTDEDQFDRHFNINFKAPFFLTQNFAKLQKKGVVINFLDSKIEKNSKNYFSYLLTKKILADFTKSAAIELGPNIRVNAVAPGITELSLDIDDPIYLEKITNSLPLQNIAKISQLVAATKFLIESDYLTGQFLFVDGGENL